MYRILISVLVFLFSFSSNVSADTPEFQEKRQKICLNMIVKDESDVIRRCLNSVMPIIDYWVIVDTGSTDGTQKIIKKHLKNIPGELYERPWRNFEANRNEALALAKGKGDYILFMDADDILEFENEPHIPFLTQDLYTMWRGTKDFSYIKTQIVKGDMPWKWVGVTHEYLDCERPYTTDHLQKVKYITSQEGASAKDPKKKFMKNVALLEDGLKKEPFNNRYAFYLAESYRDAGEKGKALECYQKRIAMGGWDEEIFWSKFMVGQLLSELELPPAVVIESLLQAHAYRPHRAEPIYYLVTLLNNQGNYAKAYEILKAREYIPKPNKKDFLFNMDWIEEYGLLFQLSICSYYVGHFQESLEACDKLLTIPHLPNSWREQTKINRTYSVARLESVISNALQDKEAKK